MERVIEKVVRDIPKQPKVIRAAGYARVSSGKDEMLHSLSAQVSYYSEMIQNHSGWLYVGVYSDEALTGTKETRPGFQRMLSDCRAGKIDLIIVKSISRFARNTVTLLQTVRELRNCGVDVYFEEQNIHTLSSEGELMLTILASYAQEESLSVSENQKWRVRKNFEEGKPWNSTMLGYRNVGGTLVIMQIPFQYSLHYYETDGGALMHKEFLAESGPDPRRAVAERLCADIPGNVCVLAFNMTFERGCIEKLAAAFPDLSEHLMSIHGNIKDLIVPFREGNYYKREIGSTFSIKSILPAMFPNEPELDYHSLEGIHNGGEAMTVFPKLKDMPPEEREALRHSLLEYCKLDTLAMVKVLDELKRVCK